MSEDAALAEFDRSARQAIARWIRERGGIPTTADVAGLTSVERGEAEASFVRLAAARLLIARRGSAEIYAYNPFCVGPTDYAVRADGRVWWAICGWDALGIPAALGTAGSVDAACGDGCGERIRVEVALGGRAASDTGAILQIGVPARSFWEDIYFT